MSQLLKLALITSGSASAIYLAYKFWKHRNVSEVSTTNTEVGVSNSIDEVSKDNDVDNYSSEVCNSNDTSVRKEVRVEGVQLWIDEAVEEYYSLNAGPSSYQNIKQDIFDNLMEGKVWNEENVKRFVQEFLSGESSYQNIKQDIFDNLMEGKVWNEENVKRFVQEFLSGERPIYIQKKISAEVPDVLSPDSEEKMSSTKQEIESMCNRYFGITRHEYLALEAEVAKRLSGEHLGKTESVAEETKTSPVIHRSDTENTSDQLANGGSLRNKSCLKVKDDEIDKKPKKGWKKWKRRIVKLFKRDKDSKSK